MLIAQLMFYVLAGWLVASSIAVVFARHPVHAVLFLILAFFNCAGLFLLLGAEFLALVLVVVYVGAVAVFFLFVVMMLDVDYAGMKTRLVSYAPLGIAVSLVLLLEIALFALAWDGMPLNQSLIIGEQNNINTVAHLLYDKYADAFLVVGMILFTAMVGAIVLTLRTRAGVKRQDYYKQNTRAGKVRLDNIRSGDGA